MVLLVIVVLFLYWVGLKFIKVVVKYFFVGVDFIDFFELYLSNVLLFFGEDGGLVDFFILLDDCMFGEFGIVVVLNEIILNFF